MASNSSLTTFVWFVTLFALPYTAYMFSVLPLRAATHTYTLWGKQVELDIPKETFPTGTEIQAMENALPDCQEHGWFQSSDGAQLHYRKYIPETKPKGVVVYQHGILAHTGNAFILKNGRKVNGVLMADSFLKAGYALYALDMRGHGFSQGLRWFVPDWRVNRNDLESFAQFVASQHSDIPLFLLGESYGSTTVLHVAKMWQDDDTAPDKFAGVVVNAPAIVSEMPPYPIVFTLRYILAPLFPQWVPFFMPNPVSADRIWRDVEVRDLHTDPRWLEMALDGGGRPFRLRTAVSLTNALEVARQETLPGFNSPFCAIHGEMDVAVPIEGTDLLDKLATTPVEDRAVYRIEDAFHDLLSDPKSDEVIGYILKFVNDRVDKMTMTTTT